MVISRSPEGDEILHQMEREGWLVLTEINEQEAISMHSHGYDLKKRGTFIRIRFRTWLGKPNPDYGYSMGGFPFSRYLMELLIDALFLTLGTRPARWAVAQLPPETVGRVFEKARKIWKKSTHKIKRERLGEEEEI
jgi:hypothetical protein